MRLVLRHSLLTVLATTVLGCGSESVTPPPTERPVASVDVTPLDGEVWAGDTRELHATPRAADGTPLPDRAVAWASSNGAVAEVDDDGNLVAHSAGSATISATSEGKRGELRVAVQEADLLYESIQSAVPEMFVLSLGGGEPRRVLPPNTVALGPVASPDGSKIAFVVADYQEGYADIFVVNRDGTDLRQLTDSPEIDDHPAWSPDGTRIAFRSFRTQLEGDIWVMNADGTNPVKLTEDPLPGVYDERRPAWSPEGTRIAFASNAGGNIDIWTMRADGSDHRRITSSDDLDTEPTWSPDGTRIAFRRSNPTERSDIMIVNATGGEPVRLPSEGDDLMPAWSPDGRLIAFALAPVGGGTPQIYTMKPDGSERTLRTVNYAWNGGRSPSWLRRR